MMAGGSGAERVAVLRRNKWRVYRGGYNCTSTQTAQRTSRNPSHHNPTSSNKQPSRAHPPSGNHKTRTAPATPTLPPAIQIFPHENPPSLRAPCTQAREPLRGWKTKSISPTKGRSNGRRTRRDAPTRAFSRRMTGRDEGGCQSIETGQWQRGRG